MFIGHLYYSVCGLLINVFLGFVRASNSLFQFVIFQVTFVLSFPLQKVYIFYVVKLLASLLWFYC